MSKSIENRLADLEARIAKLEKKPAAPAKGQEINLDEAIRLTGFDWANMEIRRDPPRTQQPSHVGKRMSECSDEYLRDYASFHDWKASKGREENPPRLNSKGKPWYEVDELTAKCARAWIAVRASEETPF
jgi:hypothetical protein